MLEVIQILLKKVFFRTEQEVDDFKLKFSKEKENIKFFVKKEGLRFHVIYVNLKVLSEDAKQHIEKFEEILSIKNNLIKPLSIK